METSSASPSSEISSKRWAHLRKILERPGPFCQPNFTPSTGNLSKKEQNNEFHHFNEAGI